MNQQQATPVKSKAVIFGASQSGACALQHLSQNYDVIAFADNNPAKAGTEHQALPVVAAADLLSLDWQQVFIASEFFEQIQRQLVQELGVNPERIQVLPTSVIKPLALGESDEVKETAEQILLLICQHLAKQDIPYYVDAGTLLGLYRDGQLIPWDDDLDLAVASEHVSGVNAVLQHCLPMLESLTGTPWAVTEHRAQRGFGAVPEGAIRGLKLHPQDSELKLPMLDVFVKYIAGDTMDYVLSSRGISMPSCHILHTDELQFRGVTLAIPSDVEDYLTLHYGDWRTPVKDWNLGMLQNASVF